MPHHTQLLRARARDEKARDAKAKLAKEATQDRLDAMDADDADVGDAMRRKSKKQRYANQITKNRARVAHALKEAQHRAVSPITKVVVPTMNHPSYFEGPKYEYEHFATPGRSTPASRTVRESNIRDQGVVVQDAAPLEMFLLGLDVAAAVLPTPPIAGLIGKAIGGAQKVRVPKPANYLMQQVPPGVSKSAAKTVTSAPLASPSRVAQHTIDELGLMTSTRARIATKAAVKPPQVRTSTATKVTTASLTGAAGLLGYQAYQDASEKSDSSGGILNFLTLDAANPATSASTKGTKKVDTAAAVGSGAVSAPDVVVNVKEAVPIVTDSTVTTPIEVFINQVAPEVVEIVKEDPEKAAAVVATVAGVGAVGSGVVNTEGDDVNISNVYDIVNQGGKVVPGVEVPPTVLETGPSYGGGGVGTGLVPNACIEEICDWISRGMKRDDPFLSDPTCLAGLTPDELDKIAAECVAHATS
jgi:hypothetical protein